MSRSNESGARDKRQPNGVGVLQQACQLGETGEILLKDYYLTLGVPRDASHEDIKKRFWHLSRALHPDANKSPAATDEYKSVTEAYNVLGDPVKRAEYNGGKPRKSAAKKATRPILFGSYVAKVTWEQQKAGVITWRDGPLGIIDISLANKMDGGTYKLTVGMRYVYLRLVFEPKPNIFKRLFGKT